MSITTIPANTSGLNMRNLTNSNFADLDGRVISQGSDISGLDTEVTTLTGSVNGLSSDVGTLDGQVSTLASTVSVLSGQVATKARKVFAYPEDFGAVRDGSTDDTAALQACITSLASLHGVMVLSAGTYRITAPLTVTSQVSIWGMGNTISTIATNQTTGHIIDITGTDPNCGGNSIFWCSFRDFIITRDEQATSGNGFNLVNTCYISFYQVYSFNSINNFYISGCGNTHLTTVYAGWTTSTTTTRTGIFIDSSVHNNASTIIDGHSVCNGGLAGATGLKVHGDNIADLFVYGFETATLDIGVSIVSTASTGQSSSTANGDLHLSKLILDRCSLFGVYISNVIGGAVAGVQISDCHIDGAAEDLVGIFIGGSSGVTLQSSQIRVRGTGSKGIQMSAATSCGIWGNSLKSCVTALSLDGNCYWNVLAPNVFSAVADEPSITFLEFLAGTNANMAAGNTYTGTATNAITLSSSSLANIVYPCIIEPGGITNSIVSAGAKGNVTFGSGYSTPVVSGDGTLGANSTNAAGTISSTKTGAAVITLTFDVGRMGGNVGFSCAVCNLTTGNLIRQTSSSQTAVIFEGVTNSGDVISYAVTAY